ncbi:MAG TPA: PepSY-associated TM helix domain-containing protein [Gammaproteobacteria bacterium]
MSHHRKHRIKIKSLYVWHRYVGLTAAIFVMLLASSGIALNHTDRFALDGTFIQSRWLLDWYGIKAPDSALTATVPQGRFTLLGTRLYFNTKPIEGDYQILLGAVTADEIAVAAVDHDLLLMTVQGEYLERLSKGDGAPDEIDGLGLDTQGRLIVTTKTGFYRADGQLLDWQTWSGDGESVAWSTTQPISGKDIAEIQSDYLNHILPWERIVLDLHSGRLFGGIGPWLMDAAAVLMLFLAGSGVFLWWKRSR